MGRRVTSREGRGALRSLRGRDRNYFRAPLVAVFLFPCVLLAAPRYGKFPLAFEENRGQWSGQVKFAARGDGYTVFLSQSEVVLVLRKPPAAPNLGSEKQESKREKRNSKI